MDYYYDLHIHSCLSPCGDSDMTPYNLVNMAALMGFDIIALTDHNTAGNCRAAQKAGEAAGITVVAGMELCTAEEVHMVCLFPDADSAEAFSAFVKTTLPPVKNKPHIFGNQYYMDEQDAILGEEEILLLTASSLTVSELPARVAEYGGFCYPAHIDRDSYSILSNLGMIDPSFGFRAVEIFDPQKTESLKAQHPILQQMKIFHSSDAHYLDKMQEPAHKITLPENTPQALLTYLQSL